jgi:hypothetical protein
LSTGQAGFNFQALGIFTLEALSLYFLIDMAGDNNLIQSYPL